MDILASGDLTPLDAWAPDWMTRSPATPRTRSAPGSPATPPSAPSATTRCSSATTGPSGIHRRVRHHHRHPRLTQGQEFRTRQPTPGRPTHHDTTRLPRFADQNSDTGLRRPPNQATFAAPTTRTPPCRKPRGPVMTTMLAARLHEIGKPMQLEQVPIPTPAPHRRRRAGQGLQRGAQPEERAGHLRRVVPLPAAAQAAGDLRPRLRRRGHRRSATRSAASRSATGSTSTPACPAGPAGPAAAARTRTAPPTPSWATSRSAPTGRSSSTPTPTADSPSTSPHPSGTWSCLPDRSPSSRAPASATSAPRFSALRKAGAGPGRTVLIDGISGTLGLGACLIALGLGVTRILGTGRNPDLLDDVKAIAPDRIDVLPAGDCAPARMGPRAHRRRGRRHRHRRPRTRRARRSRCSRRSTACAAAASWSTSAA